MVGFKTVWITLSALFLMAACVPQTKQTECRSNEAFNPSLRTCVPVIGGPTSFIKVNTASPSLPISLYKNDNTIIPLTISVSNPYNQAHTIEWERVYNGHNSHYAGNVLTTTLIPSSLASQIGNHFITAKIIANGSMVDSHTFQINISNTPRPVIVSTSIFPAAYNITLTPVDPKQRFSFTVNNNNAVIVGANYTVTWSVTKNGVAIPALNELDAFSDLSPTGNNTFYLGDSASPPTNYTFDPGALNMGVGNYIVRATVGNAIPGETVGEQQWSVTVKHPDLGRVQTISSPAPGVTTTAYHGLNYQQFPAHNFTTAGVQNQYCIFLDKATGTYPADGMGVQVRFYLNGVGSDICTKETDDVLVNQTICLDDANRCDDGTPYPFNPLSTFNTAILSFSNSSPDVQQLHKITARVFDKKTGIEFERDNVVPPSGSYPIEWPVLVKPVNQAPTIGFGATQPAGCAANGAYERIDCVVTQGSAFTVGFTINDDFYAPVLTPGKTTAPDKFLINVNLQYNGSNLPGVTSNCHKAFGVATSATIGAYAGEWTCSLIVPHFDSNVPLNPSVGTYQVVVNVQDEDSPVSPLNPKPAFPLNWKLKVTENNTQAPNITLNPQTLSVLDSNIYTNAPVVRHSLLSGTSVSELETIYFMLNVYDPELDNFRYRISLCYDPACASSTVLTVPDYLHFQRAVSLPAPGNYALINAFAYTLPENLLLLLGSDVALGVDVPVYFKVDVIDSPSILTTPTQTDSQIFAINVNNHNPAPVIDTATAIPAVNNSAPIDHYLIMTGFPITIFPGVITDASVVAAERDLSYQWYAYNGVTWNPIPNATQSSLIWTPDNDAPTVTQIRLCVGDGTAAHQPTIAGVCTASWYFSPKNSLTTRPDTDVGGIDPSVRADVAIWYDTNNGNPAVDVIYTAYVGANNDIFVDKTVRTAALNFNVTSFETVSFEALDGFAATSVTNLSITGTANSLYIAYLANSPSALVPRLRRIDKNFDLGVVGAKSNMAHAGKFGFNYNQYPISIASCPDCAAPVYGINGAATTITVNNPLAPAQAIVVNGVTLTCTAACNNANDSATHIVNLINNSTNTNLQGITAVSNANQIQLFGSYADDYLDWDGSIVSVSSIGALANGMGKIFIAGGNWFIPIINSSLAGADQNRITLLSGAIDVHLRNFPTLSLRDDYILPLNGKTALFDSALNHDGELVIASISAALATPGRLQLTRYEQDTDPREWIPASTGTSQITAFSTKTFENVKLATSAVGNDFNYVLATESTTGVYNIGRYVKALTGTPAENVLTNMLNATDNTVSFISDALMLNPVLVSMPNSSEARILFNSVGTDPDLHPRVARWRSNNTVSCGTCSSIGGIINDKSNIAVTSVVADLTLGTVGYSAGQNVKDSVFTFFNHYNGADYLQQMGLFNLEVESIQATTIDGDHRWRPPYVR